jgi:glycosyltransferase involved in cell wall biosynthesis
MTRIRLSICIATFNRADFIGETLKSILGQVTDEVEVVVVDGASTDRTPEVMSRFSEGNPRLRYVRLDQNGGVDRDYDHSVQFAAGEFCWLMTDDDLLLPGAIQEVLDAITGSVSLVVVNAEIRDSRLREILEPKRMSIPGNRLYLPGEFESFFRDTADYLSFIGGVVIRRDLWLSRNRERYYGSLFIHVGVIFQAIPTEPVLVLSLPLIAIRYGNAMWTPRSFEIWALNWPELVWSFDHFSPDSRSAVVSAKPWRQLWFLLLMRGRGAYSRAEYQRWILPRARSQREKLLPAIIAVVPGLPLNFFLFLAHRIFYRRSLVPQLDLRNSRFAAWWPSRRLKR